MDRTRRFTAPRKRTPFKEIAQDFFDYAKTHKRDQKDGQRMGRLLSRAGDKTATEITPQHVEDYKSNPPIQKQRPARRPRNAKGRSRNPLPPPL